jgi:hypothetical protein
MEIGRVICDNETPNHIRFKFQLKMGNDIKAGQFVLVNGERSFLGQVTKPSTFNPAFSDPRLIQFHERGGPDIKILYPEQEWTTADALIIGEIKESGLDITGSHPHPGDTISIADKQTLCKIFNMGNDIILGQLYSHEDVIIQFNKDTLFDHVLITGKTGSGKTYSGAVIIEGALEAGLPVVAIDPHGELGRMSVPNDVETELAKLSEMGLEARGYNTVEYAPPNYAIGDIKPFTITAGELSFSDIMAIVGLPGDIQQMILLRSMEHLRRRSGSAYDLDQLTREVERYGKAIGKQSSADTTSLRLQSLSDYGILGRGIRPQDLVKPDTVTILTLPGVDDFMQQITVSILARKLLRAREMGEVSPFFLYIEEAYLYVPNRENPPSKDALIKLVRQGRKFGIGVGISTQQPSNVDNKIIAQCHLKIILRLDASADLNYVTPWLGPDARYYTSMLPSFPDGRAIVSSKDLKRPVIVNIRARKSKHGGRTGALAYRSPAQRVSAAETVVNNGSSSMDDLDKWIRPKS